MNVTRMTLLLGCPSNSVLPITTEVSAVVLPSYARKLKLSLYFCIYSLELYCLWAYAHAVVLIPVIQDWMQSKRRCM